MLNNDMLLGGTSALGWRKIIPTVDWYEENKNVGRYYCTGYSPNEIASWGYYWNFTNSSLSNNLLEDGRTIRAIFSACKYETHSSGESTIREYSCFTRLVLSKDLGDKDIIYVKKGKTGNLFTFRGGNYGMQVSHGSPSSKPSTNSPILSKFLFLPEDRNKELDIYIGLTPPPHKKQKKVNKKKAQKGLLG